MRLTQEQQQELQRRYALAFEAKGDTLTFHDQWEVRHRYFEELRGKPHTTFVQKVLADHAEAKANAGTAPEGQKESMFDSISSFLDSAQS